MSIERITRREFLSAPRTLIKKLGRFRSGVEIDGSNDRVTGLFETAGEGIAMLAILATAYNGSKDEVVSYDVRSEQKLRDLREFSAKMEPLSDLLRILGNSYAVLNDLDKQWKRAYRNEKESCTSYTDSDGETHETCTKYYVWDEPKLPKSLGLDHKTISGSLNLVRDTYSKANRASNSAPDAFDLNHEQVLYYPKEGLGDQKPAAFLAYGSVGAAFVFYEEVIKKIDSIQEYSGAPWIDDRIGIKRRTFIKALATLPIAAKIQSWQRGFSQENRTLLTTLETHTATTIAEMNIDDSANFGRYFGCSPAQIRSTLEFMQSSIKSLTDNAMFLDNIYWNNQRAIVYQAVDKAGIILTNALDEFDRIFVRDESGNFLIPAGLTEVTKYIWATKQIQDYVRSKQTQIRTKHWLNAGVMALGLGTIAALTDIFVIPYSDHLMNKAEEI